MKAWMTVSNQIVGSTGVYGLRKKLDADPTKTEPIEHVPLINSIHGGRYLAAAGTGDTRVSKGVDYNRYEYNKTPVPSCVTAKGENGYSILSVTFANAADWNDFSLMEPASYWAQTHHMCEPKGGGGDG
jgi:hypothetical protein